jgi:hypothetical protein
MQRSKLLLVTAPALGSALLWGLVECMALWRSRWTVRHKGSRPSASA